MSTEHDASPVSVVPGVFFAKVHTDCPNCSASGVVEGEFKHMEDSTITGRYTCDMCKRSSLIYIDEQQCKALWETVVKSRDDKLREKNNLPKKTNQRLLGL
eukprot:TRINITY_DN11938_c0_g4_i1.p1 TRINITY_DN11938_c0_g4~~TRINITY_DN11938_c0_g4_i1.p1  ORF type:complete len:109 (+),score=16.33 TRINITY_DN11938_c0_g4_i1:25-327(+)